MSYSRLQTEEDRRSCWVCFATDEDDRLAQWVQPCKCRGTAKWVHQTCLQRWVDEKQKGNSTVKVACPQCNTEYLIYFPKLGPVVYVMDLIDRVIYKTCPFVAGGIFIGTVYWTMVTYGAVTVMQVLGHKEGLSVMEQADPLFLLIGLPTIPLMLILGKMVRWEDYVLRLWRKHSSKLPLINYLFPDEQSLSSRVPADHVALTDPISATRVLCGALVMPTIATIVGKLMFGIVQSNFQRTLLGGIAFIAIKGVMKIYYKQQQYLRQANRVIRNYEGDSGTAPPSAASPRPAPPPASTTAPPTNPPFQHPHPIPITTNNSHQSKGPQAAGGIHQRSPTHPATESPTSEEYVSDLDTSALDSMNMESMSHAIVGGVVSQAMADELDSRT